MNIKDYSERCEKLLGAYNQIDSLGILPIEEIDNSVLEQRRQGLLNDKFFVSVSGQIKAGKSTLLNALLFGDEILPADDTPHTAKITFIKFGEKPALKAVFYTQKEWQILKNTRDESNKSDKKKDYFAAYIEPQIEFSMEAGVYSAECIKDVALEKQEAGLSNLAQYVANKGQYTPFVNYVEIYYPLDLLRDVTFVDTPGTNDPNPVRSEVTLKWINQAHANLYVTYANAAMDQVDIDFIDKYLLGVHSRNRLVAINKIDLVDNLSELGAWIDELAKDPEFKARGIFNDRQNIINVSGMGGLLEKMSNGELSLNENMEWLADKLDEKGFLDEENHHVGFLMTAIEERIIENKGRAVLESHQQFINSIFMKKIAILEQGKAEIIQSIDLLGEDLSSLKKKRENCLEMEKTLSQSMKALISQSETCRNKFQRKLRSFLLDRRKHVLSEMSSELNRVRSVDDFKRVPWLLREIIEHEEVYLIEKIESLTGELADSLASELESLEREIDEHNIIATHLLHNDMKRYGYNVLGEMKRTIDNGLTDEVVNKIISKETWFWQRWLNTSGGRKNISVEIQTQIENLLKNVLEDQIIQKIEHNIAIVFDEGITNNVEIKIRKRIKEIRQEASDLEKDDFNKEERTQQLHVELESFINRVNEMEKLKNTILDEID